MGSNPAAPTIPSLPPRERGLHEDAIAAAALNLWAETAGGRARLVNVSENWTYRVESPSGPHMLRLHRPGYHDVTGIESELDWLGALAGTLPVPTVIPSRTGRRVERAGGRHAVLFSFEPGDMPAEDAADLTGLFETLGRYAAILHNQVARWSMPAGFTRPAWTTNALLAEGLWGDWRAAPGVEGRVAAALADAERELVARLAAYGSGPDRFGLIHADMRLANLLVDSAGRVTLIDFDDSGFGWFLYDLAASLSFIETRPDRGALVEAWCAGYEPVRRLTAEDRAIIGPMILFRRFVLLAWIGSHIETPLAQKHAPVFAADTAALAPVLMR